MEFLHMTVEVSMDGFANGALLAEMLNTRNRPLRMRLSLPDGIQEDLLLPHRVNVNNGGRN